MTPLRNSITFRDTGASSVAPETCCLGGRPRPSGPGGVFRFRQSRRHGRALNQAFASLTQPHQDLLRGVAPVPRLRRTPSSLRACKHLARAGPPGCVPGLLRLRTFLHRNTPRHRAGRGSAAEAGNARRGHSRGLPGVQAAGGSQPGQPLVGDAMALGADLLRERRLAEPRAVAGGVGDDQAVVSTRAPSLPDRRRGRRREWLACGTASPDGVPGTGAGGPARSCSIIGRQGRHRLAVDAGRQGCCRVPSRRRGGFLGVPVRVSRYGSCSCPVAVAAMRPGWV